MVSHADILKRWGEVEDGQLDDQDAFPILSSMDRQVEVVEGVVHARAWIFVTEILESTAVGEEYHVKCECIYTMLCRFTIRAFNYKFSRVSKTANPASWKQVLRIRDADGNTQLLSAWVNNNRRRVPNKVRHFLCFNTLFGLSAR